MNVIVWPVLGLALVMLVCIVLDFREMRKVTYYGGLRTWVNWRAKKYAYDYYNAQQDRKYHREHGSSRGNSEYNRGLTLTFFLVMLMVAPTAFALILLAAGAIYLLTAVGIVGGIWLALTTLPWYYLVTIIGLIALAAWSTNHLLMPLLVKLFRWTDSKLPPIQGICFAYETKPNLPMSIQMGPADNQNWG